MTEILKTIRWGFLGLVVLVVVYVFSGVVGIFSGLPLLPTWHQRPDPQPVFTPGSIVSEVKNLEYVLDRTVEARYEEDTACKLGFVPLPEFLAGKDVDIRAHVKVRASAKLSELKTQDIRVEKIGDRTVVTVPIPAGRVSDAAIIFDQNFIDRSKSGWLSACGYDMRKAYAGLEQNAQEAARKQGIEQQVSEGAASELSKLIEGIARALGIENVEVYTIQAQAVPAN